MSKHTRPVGRLLGGLWRAINTTRVVVLNLVFLFILILVFGAMAGKTPPRLEKRTTLVLNPTGMIVEQSTADPTARAISRLLGDDVPEIQLRDLVRAIDEAARDERIERMLIRPDGVMAGRATLREVAAAIQRFKDSGKQVITYAEALGQPQYHLAMQGDEVWMHPFGGVVLEGFARYRQYYRELLEDKLKVDVHLFTAGAFKSFGEPYARDGQSEEAREADLYVLDGQWQLYLAEVAQARGLDKARLAEDIDALPARIAGAGGDLAQAALAGGLVDALKTLDEVRIELMARGEKDKDGKTFRQIALKDYLSVLDARKSRPDGRPQVAVVVAMGSILDGDHPQGTVGGETVSRLLRQAREDDEVKAVVLRVNSPGGSVFASEQIRREVQLLREAGKPVIASMADVAASGGYWISMDSDEIIAHPNTVTGSIGVVGLFFGLPRTLEAIGVRTDGVATTRWAGAFDPTRPLDPEVGGVIQDIIAHTYRRFIEAVAQGRGSDPETIDQHAGGRIWTGEQALARGLVDRLGYLDDAVAAAAERAGLDDWQVTWIEREPTPFERFLASMGGSAIGGFIAERGWLAGIQARLIGTRLIDRMASDLRYLEAAREQPLRPHAHCFCGND
jgi:protease-4